jgi:hypothetical protein
MGNSVYLIARDIANTMSFTPSYVNNNTVFHTKYNLAEFIPDEPEGQKYSHLWKTEQSIHSLVVQLIEKHLRFQLKFRPHICKHFSSDILVYLNKEIMRSLIAHLINDDQHFMPYRINKIHEVYPLDVVKYKEWKIKIETKPTNHKHHTRDIISKLSKYDFPIHLNAILNQLEKFSSHKKSNRQHCI